MTDDHRCIIAYWRFHLDAKQWNKGEKKKQKKKQKKHDEQNRRVKQK